MVRVVRCPACSGVSRRTVVPSRVLFETWSDLANSPWSPCPVSRCPHCGHLALNSDFPGLGDLVPRVERWTVRLEPGLGQRVPLMRWFRQSFSVPMEQAKAWLDGPRTLEGLSHELRSQLEEADVPWVLLESTVLEEGSPAEWLQAQQLEPPDTLDGVFAALERQRDWSPEAELSARLGAFQLANDPWRESSGKEWVPPRSRSEAQASNCDSLLRCLEVRHDAWSRMLTLEIYRQHADFQAASEALTLLEVEEPELQDVWGFCRSWVDAREAGLRVFSGLEVGVWPLGQLHV